MLARMFVDDVAAALGLPEPVVRPGPDGALPLGETRPGAIVWTEGLEGCPDPVGAGRALADALAEGGLCLLAAPMLADVRPGGGDLFRFTPSGLGSVLSGLDDVWTGAVGDPAHPRCVFAVGGRGRSLGLTADRLPRLAEAQREHERAAGRFRVGPLRFGAGELARAALRSRWPSR